MKLFIIIALITIIIIIIIIIIRYYVRLVNCTHYKAKQNIQKQSSSQNIIVILGISKQVMVARFQVNIGKQSHNLQQSLTCRNQKYTKTGHNPILQSQTLTGR